MKEITTYQSDDGKFVGTYDEVLNYEKETEVDMLLNTIETSYGSYDWFVAIDSKLDFRDLLQNRDVKELFHLLNG